MENGREPSRVDSVGSILYELLVYAEWQQEPELPKIFSSSHDGFLSLLKSILPSSEENDIRRSIAERTLNWQQPWRLAVGDGGKVVAIIQELSLEIRTSRDEYSSIIGKAGLPKDLFPQWRRWCWSPDCSILAIGFSNGSVRAYDLMGSNLFTILSASCQQEQVPVDSRHALCACFFVRARTSTQKWSSELVTVNYKGQLRNFLVSPTEGFQESHTFSFNRFYPSGVTAVAYHPAHSILFIAGPTVTRFDPNMQDHGNGVGLTAWRIVNDYPFYKLASGNKKQDGGFLPGSIWYRLPSLRRKPLQSIVVRMEISPSAKCLAAIHSCGGVSLWSIPGLRKLAFWPLQEQSGWNIQNPINIDATTSLNGKKNLILPENFYPIDIDWWSDEALVLSRNSGAVSVCEISTLNNMLGESPEFLAGSAQVKRFHNGKGFLALECETETITKKRSSDTECEDDIVPDQSEDECENNEMPTSFFNHISALVSSAAYLVTDLERFRPRRKRLRLYRRTYRLLALRSTTPEELFTRKLDNEEYGDALTLAHTYNLDCDLVYQRQWRNSKVSVASIRDFLSKISKQMWVLQECVERVPESLLAARELLEFGLKATSKDIFKNLGSKRKVKEVGDISGKQCQMLVFRHILLHYQDRLATYEKILGGAQLADELFEYSAYAEFRSASSLKACVQFARAANCKAVECMLIYHAPQTQHHWLPILFNIPETICPTEYRSLLPECLRGQVLFSLKEACLRDPDWSEKEPYSSIEGVNLDSLEEDNECLYQYEPSLSAYRGSVTDLTPALIQQWYCERIRAIERSSRIVDNALALLHLAQDRNVEGLESLHQELKTLDTLVYELHLEDLSLEDLEKKSALEKCKLLMSKTSEDSFATDIQHFLFPFLDRVEKDMVGSRRELLCQYLVGVSSEDLVLPQKFFEQFLSGEDFCGVTHKDQVYLAQACLYAYLGTDQFHIAQHILSCILKSRETLAIHSVVDILEKELMGCLILKRNHTAKTLGYVRDSKNDVEIVEKLMTRMARTVAHSDPSPSEAFWSDLLKDMLDLQQFVFTCVTIHTCYEIFCSTLLSSGNLFSIKLAGSYLGSNLKCDEVSQQHANTYTLSVGKSQSLLLAAAREYIDSSGCLTDPGLELATACLHMACEDDEEVKEERDLIASFQLLHEFGISKLPLQGSILLPMARDNWDNLAKAKRDERMTHMLNGNKTGIRLCSDRLRLIDECLKAKPGAYRKVNKLLQLAACLNICGNDIRKRQGQVLVLVAESALSANDLRCCGEVCQRIISSGYAPGWEVVSQLGCCSRFNDLALRAHLLAFALQHCPSEFLQELIEARCSLEVDSLQHLVKKQLSMHNTALSIQLNDPSSSSGNALQSESVGSDFLQTLQIGEMAVRETTQRLLSRVGDSQFWKKAFHIGWDDENNGTSPEDSLSKSHYAAHAFYLSLFESAPFSASILGPQYDSFATRDVPSRILLEQALLQISCLEQNSKLEGKNTANVLIECAHSLLPEDTCLGLAHLLALPSSVSKEASDYVFGSNSTTVNLKLAQYHAALLQYRNLVSGDIEKLHDIFLHDPKMVIDFVCQNASPHDEWASVLREWKSLLVDFQQDQDLLHLNCGIDVQRFSLDEQYRHDSILGLAMSDENRKLNYALALASKYGIHKSEVITEHVVSLFLNNLPADEIMKKIKGDELQGLIKEASNEIQTRLESSVLPVLKGKNIEYLEACYEILNQVAPADRIGRLLPKDHLKLLSRVKATSAALDYKLLISGPKYTWQAVESSLTAENIPLIAKLLKAMPSSLASPITCGQLYSSFIKRQLFSFPNVPASHKDVLPLLENMKSNDILELSEELCFPGELPDIIPYEALEDLLKAAALSLQKINDTDCLNLIEKWKHHIHMSKRLSTKWPGDSFCKTFLHTRGEHDALFTLCQSVVLSEDKPLEFVLDFINTASICSFEEIVIDILKKVHSSLDAQLPTDWRDLSTLLLRMEQFVFTSSNTQPLDKEWESLLHPLASQDELPPDIRLKVLNLLKSVKSEGTEESALLWPHTRAIVASAWPQITLQCCDVLEEATRASALLNLVHHTESWQQRDALCRLLALWPAFSSLSGSCCLEIFFKILTNCIMTDKGMWTDQKASFIIEIGKTHCISFHLVDKVLQEFQQDSVSQSDDEDVSADDLVDVQLLMLVCLLCEDPKAHYRAVNLAQIRLMEPLHDCLAELALSRQIVVDLISTPAYSDLVSFVLRSHPKQATSIISNLMNRKYIPEAGAVILRSVQFVPQFMRTFSASLMVGLSNNVDGSFTNVDASVSASVSCDTAVSTTKHSLSENQQTSTTLLKDKSDWDVLDEEWDDVNDINPSQQEAGEINSFISSCRSENKMENPPLARKNVSSSSTQNKCTDDLSPIDSIGPNENKGESGDWSDNELECLPQDNSSCSLHGRAFLPTSSDMPDSPTVSFLPSSRSAFVRVPPRDQKKGDMSEPVSSQEEDSHLEKRGAAQEGWSDGSDEGWNW